MRKGCQVIIRIDAAKAIKGKNQTCLIDKASLLDGFKFYRSANGVILSPGDEAGFIPPKYFESAVQIKGKRSRVLFAMISLKLLMSFFQGFL